TSLEMFSVVLPLFMVSALSVGTATASIYTSNVWTGDIMRIFIHVLISWLILYRKYYNDYKHNKRERNSDMNAMINESINGMPIIQIFNRERQIEEEFGELNDDYVKNSKRLINLESATGENLLESFRSLIFAIMVYIF